MKVIVSVILLSTAFQEWLRLVYYLMLLYVIIPLEASLTNPSAVYSTN